MNINGRSEGIIDNLNEYFFHILGCGAIGSSASTQLARMGAENFIIYDMDSVEVQNIGVSHYVYRDIGMKKVDALEVHLKRINPDANIMKEVGRFTIYGKPLGEKDIVILGFDNMETRLAAVKKSLSEKSKPFAIIDGRMGAEHYQQYVFKNPTLKKYKDTWYSDADGDPEPCNAKATTYCSNMSGAFITNAIKKLVKEEECPREFFFNFPGLTLGYKQ
tara:strand:+ start:123 stop:779 length:657 start_codon:yes stop_codon:yes gene_type:complete